MCAFCIAAASNFGFSVIYAYTSYYVAFQTATGFTNTQLGLLLTVLGIASTILYLPGGYLADKFSPIKLMTIGLIGAGAIGFIIAQFPSYPIMLALYFIWPVFAILIAWNPQIKVLRLISEDDQQAKSRPCALMAARSRYSLSPSQAAASWLFSKKQPLLKLHFTCTAALQ